MRCRTAQVEHHPRRIGQFHRCAVRLLRVDLDGFALRHDLSHFRAEPLQLARLMTQVLHRPDHPDKEHEYQPHGRCQRAQAVVHPPQQQNAEPDADADQWQPCRDRLPVLGR